MNQKKANQELIEAAATRDLERIRRALAAGADPETTRMGLPALHVAVGALDDLYYERGGRPEIPLALLDALIEAGARIDAEANGDTALTRAAPHTEVVEHLLARGASLGSDDGTSLLAALAAHRQTRLVEKVLALGAPIDRRPTDSAQHHDVTYRAPLYAAVPDPELVERFLEAGADPDGGGGVPPLIGACRSRDAEEAIDLLIAAGADVNVTFAGKTALMHAAENGHRTYVERLLAASASTTERTSDGLDAAELSALQQHAEIAALIAREAEGEGPMSRGAQLLRDVIQGAPLEDIRALVDAGVVPCCLDRSLFGAFAHHPDVEVARFLLGQGADPKLLGIALPIQPLVKRRIVTAKDGPERLKLLIEAELVEDLPGAALSSLWQEALKYQASEVIGLLARYRSPD